MKKNISTKHIEQELKKRLAEKEKLAEKPAFLLEDILFDKQLDFVKDISAFRTAVCSRRAGKTIACAADLVHTILTLPRVNCLYVAITRGSAKNIIWRELMQLNQDFELNLDINLVELTIRNPLNDSMLYITGAKDESEIEKLRGMSFKKIYVDEAQSHRAHISKLIDDILIPATWDVSGSIALIGTPGPVPAGFFYDASHSKGWSNHKWTILDNPHIELKSGKTPELILKTERERKGISENDPTYMREALGLWVKDENALVFKFNPLINRYKELPNRKLTYIFGIDIGFNDADAIAVLGYDMYQNKIYLIEERVTRKQTITDLVNQIKHLQSAYQPVKMVMDAGALGKKIQEEIRARHGIHIEAADKARKIEFIELMNDDLRKGMLQAKEGSQFEHDCNLVTWDDSDAYKRVISDRFHSDVNDAVLYGWRECKHYIKGLTENVVPKRDSQEYMEYLADKYAEKIEKELKGHEDLVSDEDLDYIFS